MNRVTLCGRMSKKPEARYFQTRTGEQIAVVRFPIAVNKDYKVKEGEPTADFFDCEIMGKRAEVIEKYFDKGHRINVTGRVENNNYTDKNGVKHYGTIIKVDGFDFVETQKDRKGGGYQEPQEGPAGPAPEEFIDVPEGLELDLPFK